MRYLFLIFLFIGLVTVGFQSQQSFDTPPLEDYDHANVPDAANYPKDYFGSPVGFPIKLTGTFGELRPNHFHGGIDIKSPNGRSGASIFAPADGYVFRIKIQASGYGNALYIKHPNGYSTVYGHLESFRSDIAQYIKKQQYQKESFEVNLYPNKAAFPVKKGQEIGKMGNTGGSSGPHLHFEIRHSGTDKALNPLLFNLPVPDTERPSLRDLKIYTLNDELVELKGQTFDLNGTEEGQHKLNKDTIKVAGWRAGFGIKAYDSMSGFNNDNGIYAITMKANDQVMYEFKLDQIDFDDTRFMNAHIDFTAKKSGKGYYQRCFKQPGDRLPNYTQLTQNGAVPIYQDQATKIEITVLDAHLNASSLMFYVLRDPDAEVPALPPYQYMLPWGQENKIDLADFKLNIPRGCLYQDIPMTYVSTPDLSFGSFSSVFHVHNEKTPVHRYYDLSIHVPGFPEELRSKAFIADCGDSRPSNCAGDWRGDWLHTRVRHFGDFCVLTDTEPPTISVINFKDDMSGKNEMSFRIRDNYEVSGTANSLKYTATVDGQWILFDYDLKSDKITHDFDERIGSGEHFLRLIVTDDRENVATFERTFVR
jgi:murein DD-endopeptidase MepM/ murein hydrolase activator NlpD